MSDAAIDVLVWTVGYLLGLAAGAAIIIIAYRALS